MQDLSGNLMPIRKPEKNQIALQQLTLADSQRYERVILGDVDHFTEKLLHSLKNEGKIQAFRMQGNSDDPQAEVILNGGLLNMIKYTKMQKKQEEQHSLSRVTNQLLHEQMVRSNYQTTKGAERVNSASPDSRSPRINKQNYVGSGLKPVSNAASNDQLQQMFEEKKTF